jgi:Protein of unknown function (DUF1194)/Glycosyl transferase family 2
MPPTYSLVVPIFNEEAVIPVLLKRLDVLLEAFDAPAEIIVVDDGSRDTSAIVIKAKARADNRYRLIKLSRNFGHQIAITVGLDHAAGRAVIVMDADLQDPPEVVLEMIAKWQEGYDVVSAERASRQGESRFKLATANLFYRLMGRLGDVSTRRNAGDFRLVDRRALYCFLAMPERDRFRQRAVNCFARTVTFDVDLELILAVDVSDSMSTEDLRLQREGYVSAFRDPSVASAIASGEIGRIAILYLEWAGPNHFQILRPWTVLTSPKDSAAFADALATDPLAEHSPASNRAMSFGKSLDPPPIATATATSISASLLFALEMFGDRRLRTDRQVIDVSGNGKNNAGPLLAPVRDLLVSRGIVINGLPITWSAEESGDSPTSFGETFLGRYFEDCVIGGPGAFSIAANDISRFPQAVRRRLLMEIVDRAILVTPARFEAPTRARVDCSIERGER